MAKRVPKDEKPFKPVEEALVRAVMFGSPAGGQAPARATTTAEEPGTSPRIVEMPRRQTDAQAAALSAAVATPPALSLSRSDTLRKPTIADPADIGIGRRDREKRVLLTVAEEHEVERLVSRLAAELRTPVKLSHILRACITMFLHAEGELVEQTKRFPGLTRPSNGNTPEVAEFEHKIAQLVAAAFRETPPLR